MRLTLSVLILAGALTAAEVPNTLTAAERAAGWQLLFDGKSMQGWEDPARKSPAGDSWTIEDGCLHSVAHPKLREDLFTLAKYGDFELRFEWKISPGGNSGVKYRVQDRFFLDERRSAQFGRFELLANDAITTRSTTRAQASQEYVVGYEFQVIDNDGHKDARRGAYYQAGALYGMIPAAQAAAKPVGQFNETRIVVRGKHVEHWLNGVKVVDGDLDSPAALAKVADRWSTASPIYKELARQPQPPGPITLQNHGDAAWFRSIKIRKL